MTEEQVEYIADAMKGIKIADYLCTALFLAFILFMIGYIIYTGLKMQKIKKMLEEYYTTLTEEEKKKLKMYKEIKKL